MFRLLYAAILILSASSGLGCASVSRMAIPERLELLDAETHSPVEGEVLLVPLFERIDGFGFALNQLCGPPYQQVLTEPILYGAEDRLCIRNHGFSGWVVGMGMCVIWRVRGERPKGVLVVAPRYEPKIFWFRASTDLNESLREDHPAQVTLNQSIDFQLDLSDLRRIFGDPSNFASDISIWRGCASLSRKAETSFSETDKTVILGFLERASGTPGAVSTRAVRGADLEVEEP